MLNDEYLHWLAKYCDDRTKLVLKGDQWKAETDEQVGRSFSG